ncbi:uncharacterized protein LOC114327410 isoform X1 [Diabrotica virgifera virgifera]|uniref:Uncharacterized protein LOC114327410 isoform X1 n=1 Tax=Diabrotica virgifera virgifera TaxID=50390 RepID=A0A6P7FEN9_DIAVI|nr:uncharacterized protein LOC114327410 isoform X1 [Diabrotica virgifera virgifera]
MWSRSLVSFGIVTLVLHLHCVQGLKDDCDKLGILLYEDVGCTPVLAPGKSCPIKYECDLAIRNNTCLFRGTEISTTTRPTDVDFGSCNVGCFCNKDLPYDPAEIDKMFNNQPYNIPGKFTCAILDCPEWLGAFPLQKDCYRKYKLDQCCADGQMCPQDKPGNCEVDGKTVLEGQRFYPKDTCTHCVCPKNFNGKLEAPHCRRQFCNVQVRKQREVSSYCAPYYSEFEGETLCCPSSWICPSDEQKIITVNPKAEKSADLTCQYGKKKVQLGEGFETTVKGYDNVERAAKCECVIPPFLTCRQVKK